MSDEMKCNVPGCWVCRVVKLQDEPPVLEKKEDSERAEAVLETLYRGIRDKYDLEKLLDLRTFREFIHGYNKWLVEVFINVRGR